MSTPRNRVLRYCERADECIRLADIVGEDPLRSSYVEVAERYLMLARAELEQLMQELPTVIMSKAKAASALTTLDAPGHNAQIGAAIPLARAARPRIDEIP